jgi:Tfp pilus assembly protein PilN
MINLLPPQVKTQVAYSRNNRVLLHYLTLTVFLAVALSGSLLGAAYYLDQDIKRIDGDLADKKQEIASYKNLQAKAKLTGARLASIKTIQQNQAKFSVLLVDLAKYMPQGTVISSITLTGDDKQPVRLTVNALDYKTALSFRDSIAQSPRISAADIENIKRQPNSNYSVVVVFAFKPGDAK